MVGLRAKRPHFTEKWLRFTLHFVAHFYSARNIGTEGGMANADHVIGALVLTVLSVAAAEVTRAARFLLIPLGIALLITPFVYDAAGVQLTASLIAGVALIVLSLPRGAIQSHYGTWNKWIV